MSERKTEEEKINEKRSFLQKILGFRFTHSISAWKLAIALFFLMAIAYAVNGAGIILIMRACQVHLIVKLA